MDRRIQLHEELCMLLGSNNVYYQPPESLKMKYPCIRYSRSDVHVEYANDSIYRKVRQYKLIVIDQNPDNNLDEKIMSHFSKCSLTRIYVADNLNHYQLTLYY